MPPARSAAARVSVSVPGPRNAGYLRECWERRELLWFFARRDLAARYRQTLIGVGWVLLRPALAMGVFSLLFGAVAGLEAHGLPYPLIVLCGMLPWQYVASVLSEGTSSLANNPSLVTKVYFPRLLMPASSLLLNAVDLAVNACFLAAMLAWYGLAPPWQAVFAPLAILLAGISALGATLWASALAVRYRDVRAIIPVILQFGLLLTPVAWTVAALPEAWRQLAWLNPLAGPVELLRWCLLPGAPLPTAEALLLSTAAAIALLLSGYIHFRNTEHRFADVI